MTGSVKRLLWWVFPWESVFQAGVWLYEEHRRTGARRAVRVISGGHSPQDRDWLERRPPSARVPPSALI